MRVRLSALDLSTGRTRGVEAEVGGKTTCTTAMPSRCSGGTDNVHLSSELLVLLHAISLNRPKNISVLLCTRRLLCTCRSGRPSGTPHHSHPCRLPPCLSQRNSTLVCRAFIHLPLTLPFSGNKIVATLSSHSETTVEAEVGIEREAAISMTSATTGGMEGEGEGAAMVGGEGVIAMVVGGGESRCDMRYLACVSCFSVLFAACRQSSQHHSC